MANYIELTKDTFKDVTKEGICLVDFWAPWCGPCKMLTPIIDELAKEFEGKAKICKVNSDNEQDLSMEFGIRSIPTIMFFKDGELVGENIIGATSKQVLTERLEQLL